MSSKSEVAFLSQSLCLLDRLTAFVLKSFAQAQSHIFVESAYIMNALTWLSQRQTESGCFQRSGSLLNNAMKVMLSLNFALVTEDCEMLEEMMFL
jgi:hypothetical protein